MYQDNSPCNKDLLIIRLSERVKTIIRNNKVTWAKSVKEGLIQKLDSCPSHDFNIFKKMQDEGNVNLSKDMCNNLIVSELVQSDSLNCIDLQLQSYLHNAVISSNINMNLPFKDQDMVEVTKVVAFVCQTHYFIIVSLDNLHMCTRWKRSILSSRSTKTLGQSAYLSHNTSPIIMQMSAPRHQYSPTNFAQLA